MSDALRGDPREYSERDPDDGRPRVYDERDRADDHDPRDGLMHDLDLPLGEEREFVVDRDRVYELNGEDGRTLAAVGAFRVVPAQDPDIDHDTLDHLRDEGLVETVDLRDDERGVVLTKDIGPLVGGGSRTTVPGPRLGTLAGTLEATPMCAYRADVVLPSPVSDNGIMRMLASVIGVSNVPSYTASSTCKHRLASSRSFHRKANSSPRRAPLNGASPTMVRGFRHDRYSKSATACKADPPRVHWSDLRIRHSHVRVRLGASGLEPGEGPLHADAPAPC